MVITSVNGSAYTIFDGQGQAFTGLTVNPGPLTSSVYGITFTNFAGSAINLTAGSNSVLTLVDCRFMNNRAARGGAIYMYSGRVQATNCVFRGNLANVSHAYAGGAINFMSSYPNNGSLVNCEFSDNVAPAGGGGALMLGNPVTIINCSFSNNVAAQDGGAIRVLTAGNVMSDSRFVGNVASNNAGGVLGGLVINSYIAGNSASNTAGGIMNSTLYNCIVVSNIATRGGGMRGGSAQNTLFAYNVGTNVHSVNGGGGVLSSTLRNCTVVSNSAPNSVGGGVLGCRLENTIVWHNSALHASYSNRYAWDGASYTNSITAPYYAADGAPWVNCSTDDPMLVNFRPVKGSPAINAGLNQDWMIGDRDLDWHTRIGEEIVDIGAYEYHPPGTVIVFQ